MHCSEKKESNQYWLKEATMPMLPGLNGCFRYEILLFLALRRSSGRAVLAALAKRSSKVGRVLFCFSSLPGLLAASLRFVIQNLRAAFRLPAARTHIPMLVSENYLHGSSAGRRV